MKQVLLFLVVVVISLSSKQLEIKESGETGSQKNNTIVYPPYPKYPDYIEYYVHDNKARKLIEFVFGSFNSPSLCVRFRNNHSLIRNKIGINFFVNNSETNVTLSYNESIPTNVSLNKNAIENSNLKEVAFGVDLALGFIPEVERSDKYDNIDFNLVNISENYKKYYKQNITTNTSTDFDFTSMMLGGFSFGAQRNKIAFRSKLYPYYENMLESIQYFISYNDKRRLYEIYCYDKCEDKPPCENGGYYVKNCSYCNCPPEFRGTTCNEMDQSDCVSRKTKKIYNLTTEHIEDLELEDIEGRCIFLIKSDNNNSKVIIEIEKITFGGTFKLSKDRFIEIRYRNDKGTKGLTIYQNVSNITLPSLSDKVYLITKDDFGTFDLTIRYHANTSETYDITLGHREK